MTIYYLDMLLRSDATFGRGDGVTGLIDQEVEHDAYGFPYLRGRTLKGLLSEACDNIVAFLPEGKVDWNAALVRLFGVAGSTTTTAAAWQIGDACLPDDVRTAVADMLDTKDCQLTTRDILESLTTIRRQTAMHPTTGTPHSGSLRAMRVIIRNLVFTSRLETSGSHSEDIALLAAGCLALRHVGSGRNRGRGEVSCTLRDHAFRDVTLTSFTAFAHLIKESA